MKMKKTNKTTLELGQKISTFIHFSGIKQFAERLKKKERKISFTRSNKLRPPLSVTFMVLEAAGFQGTSGTSVRFHIVHRWALRHVGGCGFFWVLVTPYAIMVAMHGSVHGCSVAA